MSHIVKALVSMFKQVVYIIPFPVACRSCGRSLRADILISSACFSHSMFFPIHPPSPHIAPYCPILPHVAPCCPMLPHVTPYCSILPHIAPYCPRTSPPGQQRTVPTRNRNGYPPCFFFSAALGSFLEYQNHEKNCT